MTTLRGAIRSYNAAVRRAEREQARAQKDYARRVKAYEKQRALDDAADAVEQYESLMGQLLGFHIENFEEVEWSAINTTPEPKMPSDLRALSSPIQNKLNNYKPNFLVKFFKLENWIRDSINRKLIAAGIIDDISYKKVVEQFHEEHKIWSENFAFSGRVLAGDLSSYREFIQQTEPFNELRDLGTSVDVEYVNKSLTLVTLNFKKGDSVIPTESKDLLKSGKLTEKKIPQNKLNTMFQDHVCSAVLGVAAEMFALLPLDTVVVTGRMKMLDTSTGKMKETVVISAKILRETLSGLNMNEIDPSDAMRNFICNMDFKPATGFKGVDEIRYRNNDVA